MPVAKREQVVYVPDGVVRDWLPLRNPVVEEGQIRKTQTSLS
jgi:hypothetical protein